MTSQIANQTRTVTVAWNYTSDSTDVFAQTVIIPFLVDEIRVAACGTQLLDLGLSSSATDPFGNSILLTSDDLVGTSGGILGVVRTTSRDRYGSNTTITSVNSDYVQNIRHIFPPSAKRNVNGSYRFNITKLNGDKLNKTTTNDFTVILVLEFIQYKEVEKQQLDTDDDLRHLSKSGRRRL